MPTSYFFKENLYRILFTLKRKVIVSPQFLKENHYTDVHHLTKNSNKTPLHPFILKRKLYFKKKSRSPLLFKKKIYIYRSRLFWKENTTFPPILKRKNYIHIFKQATNHKNIDWSPFKRKSIYRPFLFLNKEKLYGGK